MLQSREYAPKEVELFEGIVTLLNDGRSIHELKVADIAAAAGMGKGTAYEYFSSKEEIIREAIRYHICLEFKAFSEFVSARDEFVSMLEKSMDYIVDMIQNRFSSLLIMALSLNFSDIQRLTSSDENLFPTIENEIFEQMSTIFRAGKQEGVIGRDVTAEECTFVLGGLYSAFSCEVRFLLGREPFERAAPKESDIRKPCKSAEECLERIENLKKMLLKVVLKALH
ncbi:MAG: helix-turn-helix transcriptional regulator [Clostridiales bacterium]|nr:helix-turn-helix transcriptional regulator [Clostridiales bacterium]